MHHKIMLPPPILPTDIEAIFLWLKATPVIVLPNGNRADKAADLTNTTTQQIDSNTILFITAGKYIKNNHVLLHLFGKGNHCLLIPCTMIEILAMLPAGNFMQVHDSYSINKNFAVSVSPHFEIHLYDFDLPIPIGRHFSEKIDKILFPNSTYHYGKRCPHKKIM